MDELGLQSTMSIFHQFARLCRVIAGGVLGGVIGIVFLDPELGLPTLLQGVFLFLVLILISVVIDYYINFVIDGDGEFTKFDHL